MTMGNISNICFTLAIVFLIGSIVVELTVEKELEIVPCYDKHGNEIIGIDCEKEIYTNPILGNFFLYSMLLIVFGFWTFMFAILEGKD